MNETIKKTLKIIIFFAVGLLIFWWVYKDQDTKKIGESLKDANWFWIGVSLVLALLSHLSRAIRWNLLINPLGYKPRTINSFFAIMILYLSNMAVPRSGEIARCGTMNKYEKVPFAQLVGTVFIDRVFDFVVLFIMLGIVLLTQFPVVMKIIENNPDIMTRFNNLFSSLPVILILVGLGVVFMLILWFLREKIKKTLIYSKIREIFVSVFQGLKTVISMEKKGQFFFHTFFIWLMYFLMIYVSFFAFEPTKNLDLLTGLTVFVMASFGMVVPSPGGIGTWHFMVIQTLVIYNVAEIDASAFAFATHGSMTLFLIVAGAISFVLLPIVNKDIKPRK